MEANFVQRVGLFLAQWVCKQENLRILDEEQPKEVQELPLYPEKTTVRCDLGAGRVIGPHFFTNDNKGYET